MATTVMVAMSGGVDSAVAAYLLKTEGYDCMGVTMKLFSGAGGASARAQACGASADVEDARAVAQKLGIPHEVIDFTADFDRSVIKRFIEAYENGRTPNPCVDCNRFIKFGRLRERADQLKQDYIATGHYARVGRDPETGEYLLKKAVDTSKDQSYVLYYMTQAQLGRTLFPLGGMNKNETRAVAAREGLGNARKGDSQDICFVPGGDYAAFMEQYTGRAYPLGDFISPEGRAVGRHKGQARYTIGQRRGLGLAAGAPVYVLARDAEKNTVTIGPESLLFSRRLTAGDVNWISGRAPEGEIRVAAKTRYRQPEQPATARMIAPDRLEVIFDQPQRAITAGQAVVLYQGDVVLGGGTIL